MSKEALRLLNEQAFNELDHRSKYCNLKKDYGAEDIEMGKCLQAVNVFAGDSRDNKGRVRFFPFTPQYLMNPTLLDKDFWYWRYLFYNPQKVMIKKIF